VEKSLPTVTRWTAIGQVAPPQGLRWWLPLIGTFLLANVAVAPLMDEVGPNDWAAVFVYACFGIIPAQAAALSVWLAWGPQPFWQRLWVHWSIAAFALVAWLFGLVLAEEWDDVDGLEKVLPMALLFGLTVQLPLWVVRGIWGWRLTLEQEAASGADDKLTIRDLMVGTVIVAVSLAVARTSPESDNSSFWSDVGMALAIVAGASTLALLPTTRWLLGGRSVYLAVLGTFAYAWAAVAVLVGAYMILEPSINGRDVWEMFGISVSIFSFAAMLIWTAIAARRSGWRLARS
jgi:hypothetical protein